MLSLLLGTLGLWSWEIVRDGGGDKERQDKARQDKAKQGKWGSKCNRSGLEFSLFTSFFHPGVLRVSHRSRGYFCVGFGLGLGLVICVLKLFGVFLNFSSFLFGMFSDCT